MKMTKMMSVATIAMLMGAASVSAQAADASSGLYVRGAVTLAHTTLDTSNTVHETYITSDNVNKLGYELNVGYRFNRYIGAEVGYVDFGTPDYHLTRGVSGETSVMSVKNKVLVAAVRGYYPVTGSFDLTGRAGAAFVHTSLDRESTFADDAYTGKDNQVHPTVGLGLQYKLTQHVSLTTDANWYPKITKTNDQATDTNAFTVNAGLQYQF